MSLALSLALYPELKTLSKGTAETPSVPKTEQDEKEKRVGDWLYVISRLALLSFSRFLFLAFW